MSKYRDGWKGFTKAAWTRMWDVPSYQHPVWITCYGGAHIFLAEETLRSNGFHPDKIPELFKSGKGTISELLEKISKTVPLTFVPTPDK